MAYAAAAASHAIRHNTGIGLVQQNNVNQAYMNRAATLRTSVLERTLIPRAEMNEVLPRFQGRRKSEVTTRCLESHGRPRNPSPPSLSPSTKV